MNLTAVSPMLRGVMSLAVVTVSALGTAFAQQGVKQKEIVPPQGPYQNKNMKPTTVTVTSGMVSVIETSIDGARWIGVAASTNQNMTLKPGQWLRVTYSALPNMNEIY